MKISFALVSEGSSEHALVPRLEELCVQLGATEAIGTIPPFELMDHSPGKTVIGRLKALRTLCPEVNLVFVHRDADSAGHKARRMEIEAGTPVGSPTVVPLIPVTELEAWLLLDESELFAAVGRPSKTGVLSMPKVAQVEQMPDPKTRLKTLLREASGKTGRRPKQVDRNFSKNRRFLVERLNLDGPVTQLPAWQRLVADLQAALAYGAARSEPHV